MDDTIRPDARWKLVAGSPSLDFVNTVGGRVKGEITRDDIPDYDCLVRWSGFADVVPPGDRDRLRDQGRRAPAAATSVLRRALRLRESIFRIGAALVANAATPLADLRVLDREVREARRHQRLASRRGRLELTWSADGAGLDRVLWPVALDAAAVFGSDSVARLKQCGGSQCGWLFLDTTRNHSRQWCDMSDCGNLAKVRRFRQRLRRRTRRASA